ncbi:hypothetical protein ACOMHN_022303 [Nucella lapillus]
MIAQIIVCSSLYRRSIGALLPVGGRVGIGVDLREDTTSSHPPSVFLSHPATPTYPVPAYEVAADIKVVTSVVT